VVIHYEEALYRVYGPFPLHRNGGRSDFRIVATCQNTMKNKWYRNG